MKRKIKKKNWKSSERKTLSLFQRPGQSLYRKCPLSGKGAPIIDYKNIKVLKKFMTENGKIMPSRITNVSFRKQRLLSQEIKRARILALI